ncbi:DUF3126 family protein [Entomobacter blattae]|uniref:DUF3126 domain-containing protein n=1 Tax=Entomobacter blattae TaxID=2762277 RepID=A0A7H1NPG2_9PROT|nr:DUF3126 family protein [Entomobacter blattae]QNT77672.1 hypothetical protein JGUZn3_04220 [Entomobacter blattae]
MSDQEMSVSELSRVQTCLRRLLGAAGLKVSPPPRPGLSVEVSVGGEVIGTLYKDNEDGETSYDLHITVLEEDLPPQ